MNLCNFSESFSNVDSQVGSNGVYSTLQVRDGRDVRVLIEVRHELLDGVK
jgi:hypothetical protein